LNNNNDDERQGVIKKRKNQTKNKKMTTNTLTRVSKRSARNTKGTYKVRHENFLFGQYGAQEIYKGCHRH